MELAARELMFCGLHDADEMVLLVSLRAEVDRGIVSLSCGC